MKEIILAKYGEVALKGQNRPQFEAQLLKTIRKRVAAAGLFEVYKAQSTVYIEPMGEGADVDRAMSLAAGIFGIAVLNRAIITEKDVDVIARDAIGYLAEPLQGARTFKVTGRRADKSFPLTSMQLAAEVGERILEAFPHLSVDVKYPEAEVVIEIRDYAAYIHSGKIEAAGGMPTGTSGRAAVMLSGGIDSPVAAYMMAKRGLQIVGVHFMSPPYTSEQAHDKVVQLAARLSFYTGDFPLLSVPFTDVQVKIHRNCPEPLFTVLMRRSMMRITGMLCGVEHCGAVITGESLAQVASQTLDAIACTDEATPLPVLRPLIGMDKVEITALARRIGTFETSILPYEDCCTIFTPKHPKTKPKIADVITAEQNGGYFDLEKAAAENYTVKMLHFNDEGAGR